MRTDLKPAQRPFALRRRSAVIAAAGPFSSDASAALAARSDFFASDSHYQSLAGRIVAALHDGARLILVTGDPPVSPHLLSPALSKAAWPRYAVTDVHCGPELRGGELSRLAPGIAPPPASGGETGELNTAVSVSPLLVFDDLDRLSDEQLQEIHEAILFEERVRPAAVLLAHRGSLVPVQLPALRFFENGLSVHFRLQDVGPDESIAYLRHQLARAQRHSRALGPPRGMVLGFFALGFVMIASIVGFALVPSITEWINDTPTSAATGISSITKASASQPITGEGSRAASAQPTPAVQLATNTAIAPRAFAPVPFEGSPREAPPDAGLGPAPPTTGSRLSAPEIAAYLARGDKLLGIRDIVSARLFYERAADAGDALAARRLGTTFDPAFLRQAGMPGDLGDPAQALFWYQRARGLGSVDAGRQPEDLETKQPAEPDPRTK